MTSSKNYFRILPIATAISLALTGCASDVDTDSASDDSVTVSGIVADGYLENATVCLDINENKLCDTDEPQATTDSDGKYSFSSSAANVDKFPVVSVISALTKDADDPTRTLEPYVMSAPVGKPDFISPVTTMIQTEIESNPGISVAEAESAVKANLGYSPDSTISLFKDYVAAKADSTDANKDDYARVHKIAQLTARTLETNQEVVKAAALEAGRDPEAVMDELVRLVVKQVIDNIQNIADEVDTSGSSFDAGTAAAKLNVRVSTDNIEEDIAAEEAVSSASKIDIATILQDGVNFILSEYSNDVLQSTYEISKRSTSADNLLVVSSEEWDGTNWAAVTDDSGSDTCQSLTATGLVTHPCERGTSNTVVDNGDGTVNFVTKDANGNSVGTRLVKAIEIPLADKLIRGTFPKVDEDYTAWVYATPGSATFTTNAKGYRMSFTRVGDSYKVLYKASQSGDCTYLNSNNSLTTANCVAIRDANGPVALSGGLSSLAGSTSYTMVFDFVNLVLTADATDSTKGTVTYSIVKDNATLEVTANYAITTPLGGSVEILEMDIPKALRFALNYKLASKLFIVADEGYARLGKILPDGASNVAKRMAYNSAATTDLKNCFMGGTATGSCQVKMFLKDGKLSEGATITTETRTMVPFNLAVAGTTMDISTDGSTTRWSFAFNNDADATGWATGTITPAGKSAQNMKWKVIGNGRLKIKRSLSTGSKEFWIMTQLTGDTDTLHLRRKRFSSTGAFEKNFGGYVTDISGS